MKDYKWVALENIATIAGSITLYYLTESWWSFALLLNINSIKKAF